MMRSIHAALVALLGALLVACGGGSNGTVAEGGIGGTGISSGSISAFGSVVVNGTRFDVDAAEITVNGMPASEAELEIGYGVRIEGDLEAGVADTLAFDADLLGEVDANSILPGSQSGDLTVMQRTVRLTDTTILDGVADPATIAAGERVLVSGFRDSTGALVANHLARLPASGTDQVVGRVTAQTDAGFRIGALEVVTGAQREVGVVVRVRGDYEPVTREFSASSVAQPEDLAVSGVEIELEGIVDAFTSENDFTVAGVRIDAGAAVIEGGTIALDAEVEVEGAFDTANVLVAEWVEVEREDNVEIEAPVAAVDPTAGTVALFDPGDGGGPRVTATVTPTTRIRDGHDDVEPFALEDLAVGDWVELDAFENGDGSVTALQLERIEPQDEVSVEGAVDAITPLTVLGLEFDTSGAGSLPTIGAGDIVEVEWNAGDTFTQPMPVDEVELEDDD